MSKAKPNQQPEVIKWRFYTVIVAICLVFTGLVARAAYIQVIEPDKLIKQGDIRHVRTLSRDVHRGMITDRNGVELAVSVPVKAVWADPKIVHDKGSLKMTRRWKALADVLGIDEERLINLVAKNPQRRFVYIQRQVSPAMANYVKELGIPGVQLRNESRRYYPGTEISAHLVGFTNVDDKGIEGIEKLFDDVLTGKPGSRKIRRDAKGRQIEVLDQEKAEEAKDVVLSIDQRIQTLAYKELKAGIKYFDADAGSIVISDIETGEILALVNGPSYNPNNRKGVEVRRFRNRAITDVIEPGSTLKPMAVISTLEFEPERINTIVDTSPGWFTLGGRRVHDRGHNYGKLDLTHILKRSSNVGTSKLALDLPKEHFVNLYYDVGFGSDTGTGLIGESSGIFHERGRWSDHEIATLSFGYAVSVTNLQLNRFYNMLGNGGILRPLSVVKTPGPTQGERVISEFTANSVVKMMEQVVQPDGVSRAQVPGYRVAGKTGTAYKADAGGYSEDVVVLFAGIAPVSDPKIAVTVMVDNPKGDLYSGGEVAAPIFSKVTGGTLQLLNVAPDKTENRATLVAGGRRNVL